MVNKNARQALTAGLSPPSGFSITELLIVIAIMMVITALALPTMQMIRTANLRQAGSDYASLLQSARIQAVQNDTYFSVVTTTSPVEQAFIDLQGNGVYAQGDPVYALPSYVHVKTYADNPPALSNLESLALASASDPSLDTTDNPTFGPRGLPCKPINNNGYTTCPATVVTVNGTSVTSYITFFQNNANWVAVVVNPAARIRVFYYSASSANWQAAE
jgi:Tfp pilus assembly protein FimT